MVQNMADEAYQILNNIEEWQRKHSDFFQKKSGILAHTDMSIYDLMTGLKIKLKYFQELALDIDSDARTLQVLLINRKQGTSSA